MIKLLSVLFLGSALVLTGCGDTEESAEGELQDGTYRIEELNCGSTGWKEALEIVVDGGAITDANFESVNEDDVNKIEDEDYQETMTNVSGTGPQDFIPELEEQIVGMEKPSDVEVVTGATSTSEKIQEWAEELYSAAEEGNTDTIQVDNQDE